MRPERSKSLQKLNIFLFGNDAIEKTFIGNIILNYDGFRDINDNNDPVCISATTEDFPGKFIEVIDTPRLSLPREKIIKAIQEKQEEYSSTSAKFSALFVVRANSVSDTDCGESINIFKDVFGRQFSGRIVVVVTHFDKVGRNINLKSFLGSCGAQLRSFIRERNLEVFFFDNFSHGDIRTSQVNDLISMIVSEKNTMVPIKKKKMSASEDKKATVSEKKTWSWTAWSTLTVVTGIACMLIYNVMK